LLYVEPLYVQGTSQNSFPLLQKVLVDYGDRIGYGNTLAEALDQVFGAGAGSTATDNGQDSGGGGSPTTTPAPATTTAPAPTISPPSTGNAATNPAVDKAVQDLDAALSALATAQRSGDFAAIGQAESDLQKAAQEYQSARSSAGSSSSATASPSG
jgi:hypothetical protein